MKTLDLKSVLKIKGYKVTKPRMDIIRIISRTPKPISADLLFNKLKKNNIDRATVYRTLTSFENKGILKKVNLQRDSLYYEMANDHHHHIICTKCGRIEDFKYCLIGPISKKVLTKSPHFRKVDQHSIELFSVCKNCSKR